MHYDLFQISKRLHTIKGTGNRGRISTYQKPCIPQCMISDRLIFLFSVPYSFYCAELLRLTIDTVRHRYFFYELLKIFIPVLTLRFTYIIFGILLIIYIFYIFAIFNGEILRKIYNILQIISPSLIDSMFTILFMYVF